jgi:hypothetical protein
MWRSVFGHQVFDVKLNNVIAKESTDLLVPPLIDENRDQGLALL